TVISYTGDAFSKEIREKLVSHGPYDAIISDAAPMTTGNRSVDTSRSEWLAEHVLMLAEEHLKVHGNLVIKIFQGGGEVELLKRMRQLFVKAKPFKPKASRSDSFEIFLVGLDRLASQEA
ncbi:MAG: RlmE family RNA methyltransferase, partial [Sphaerochaetaceae bacterium]|nr:RlmE family RNA methyltransferase [Sphaerochaetaceae bacterium]